MIKFKLLGALVFLSMLSLAQPPAFGGEGRQTAAPPWSAACMTDHGPSDCGEPMWIYGAPEEQLGKDNLALRLTSREAKDERARAARCSCAAAVQTPLGELFADPMLLRAQRAGAKYLMLTHLIPPIGADQQYPFKVPGGPLTADDYRRAAEDGGFTGNIIVGRTS